MGPSIIIKAIKWHLKDFIGLSKPIPGSVVPFIDLNGMSIKCKRDWLDGRIKVSDL